MKMQYGAYIAMAGIGLYAMFVAEIISIFNFMADPTLKEFFEPVSKIFTIHLNRCRTRSDHVWYILYDCKEIWIKTNWFGW